MNNKFKIKAIVTLSMLPVDVELYVDKVVWLTSTQEEQSHVIWRHIGTKYPMNMQVATTNSDLYPNTSWIEVQTIKVTY